MSKKLPAMQWYSGDWRKDPGVQAASLATRGFWREILDCMWEAEERGTITRTLPQFARMAGCTVDEATDCINEIVDLNIGNVKFERYENEKSNKLRREYNGRITLINRRMKREEKDRRGNRLRQSKYRERAGSNRKITPEKRKITPLPSASASASPPQSPPSQPASWFDGEAWDQRAIDRVMNAIPPDHRDSVRTEVVGSVLSHGPENPTGYAISIIKRCAGEIRVEEKKESKRKEHAEKHPYLGFSTVGMTPEEIEAAKEENAKRRQARERQIKEAADAKR